MRNINEFKEIVNNLKEKGGSLSNFFLLKLEIESAIAKEVDQIKKEELTQFYNTAFPKS